MTEPVRLFGPGTPCPMHGKPIGPPPATNCEDCRSEIRRTLSESDTGEYAALRSVRHSANRPVERAHLSMSGQFHAGCFETLHRGSGMSPRYLHMATVCCRTPSRSAMSSVPTGSHGRAMKVTLPCRAVIDNLSNPRDRFST